jgi:hypothetical protein
VVSASGPVRSSAGAGTGSFPVVRVSRSARVEGVVQVVIMLAIGGAAGAGSFTHVHDVAAAHGQAGWLAWADAVVLELMSIASGLELRRRKRGRMPVGFPASVMVAAVALSLSAQVVEAERSVIGWIAAAIPALGFLVMVKIALAQAGSSSLRAATVATAGLSGSLPASVQERASLGEPVPLGRPAAGQDQAAADGRRATSGADPAAKPQEAPLPVAEEAADQMVAALIPVARAVAEALERERRRLSRQALAAGLRQQGHPVSNARVCALLKILRSEPLAVPDPRGPVGTASAVARRQARALSRRPVVQPDRQNEDTMHHV